MVEKITNNQVSDILNELAVKRTGGMRSGDDSRADASLDISYASLLEQAGQETVDDAKIVERARQLLLSGQLDRPENIRKAAQNILERGI